MIQYGLKTPDDAEKVNTIDMIDRGSILWTIEEALANLFHELDMDGFRNDDLDGAQHELLGMDGFKVNLIRGNEYATFDLKIENIKFYRAEEIVEEDEELSMTKQYDRDNPRGSWNIPN